MEKRRRGGGGVDCVCVRGESNAGQMGGHLRVLSPFYYITNPLNPAILSNL